MTYATLLNPPSSSGKKSKYFIIAERVLTIHQSHQRTSLIEYRIDLTSDAVSVDSYDDHDKIITIISNEASSSGTIRLSMQFDITSAPTTPTTATTTTTTPSINSSSKSNSINIDTSSTTTTTTTAAAGNNNSQIIYTLWRNEIVRCTGYSQLVAESPSMKKKSVRFHDDYHINDDHDNKNDDDDNDIRSILSEQDRITLTSSKHDNHIDDNHYKSFNAIVDDSDHHHHNIPMNINDKNEKNTTTTTTVVVDDDYDMNNMKIDKEQQISCITNK